MAHASKMISAELMMAHFIAKHNLSFQAVDHLSAPMFPNSKIAAYFSCKHNKTKSDALYLYMSLIQLYLIIIM